MGLTPVEQDLVTAGTPGEVLLGPAGLGDLESRGDLAPGLDLVVIGSGDPRPVETVQRVRLLAPDAAVVVLTTTEHDPRVRRELSYAPGVPLDLVVHDAAADPGVVGDLVAAALARAGGQRRHRAVLTSLAVQPPAEPGPRSLGGGVDLGPLLEHAPVGVLVCAPEGAVLGWNRYAGSLLDLEEGRAGVPLVDLLPGAVPALLAEPSSTEVLDTDVLATTAAGRDLEVTAVTSEDDGRPVVLLLLVDVTASRHAERDRERLAGRADLLAAVARTLEGTLDMHEALDGLAGVLVPRHADWVSIQLAEDPDRPADLSLVALRHRDPALGTLVEAARERQRSYAVEHAPSRRVARTGVPLVLSDLDAESVAALVPDAELREMFLQLGLRSALAVPLPGRRGILGSLILVRGPDSPSYTAEDLVTAAEVGSRAGLALDNARLYSQQRNLALELQRTLMTEPPQPGHSQIVVRYVAASHEAQVGGDWYDAFLQPDGATVLVVGDVVGHDRRAAAAMSQVRGVLRGIGYTTGADPAELLTRTDEAMEGLLIPTIATGVVARLEQSPEDRAAGRTWISWSNAGHPPPLVMHPGGHVTALRPHPVPGGPPMPPMDRYGPVPELLLGFDPRTPRTSWRAVLPPGATVLFYSDGLVERRGEAIDDGLARLVGTLETIGPRPTLDELCDATIARMVAAEHEDDVALVAVRLHDERRPRPPEAGPQRVPPRA